MPRRALSDRLADGRHVDPPLGYEQPEQATAVLAPVHSPTAGLRATPARVVACEARTLGVDLLARQTRDTNPAAAGAWNDGVVIVKWEARARWRSVVVGRNAVTLR